MGSPQVVDHHREALAERGVLHLPGLVPPEAARSLHAAIAGALDDVPESDYGLLLNDTWRRVPELASWLRGGPLGAVLTALHGGPLLLFQDNLVWKRPGTGRAIEWHQDYSYWPLDCPEGLTAWLALDDADEDSGALVYAPGTHQLGECEPADFISGSGQPTSGALPPLELAAMLPQQLALLDLGTDVAAAAEAGTAVVVAMEVDPRISTAVHQHALIVAGRPALADALGPPWDASRVQGSLPNFTANRLSATLGLEVRTGVTIYGAISAREVTFPAEANVHYDTTLRSTFTPGVERAFLLTDWRELTNPAERVTLP
jgi:hypothetical protein